MMSNISSLLPPTTIVLIIPLTMYPLQCTPYNVPLTMYPLQCTPYLVIVCSLPLPLLPPPPFLTNIDTHAEHIIVSKATALVFCWNYKTARYFYTNNTHYFSLVFVLSCYVVEVKSYGLNQALPLWKADRLSPIIGSSLDETPTIITLWVFSETAVRLWADCSRVRLAAFFL